MTSTTAKCACGCGLPAPLAKRTQAALGMKAGEPLRFVHGHNARKHVTVADLLPRCTVGGPSGTCWLWPTLKPNGYGYAFIAGKKVLAHRAVYEFLVGPIPEGLELDHLCRAPACVNPEHLEPVTHQENVRRGLRGELTTHCPKGHPYDEENTYVCRRGRRTCRECARARWRAWDRERRAAA